MSKGVKNMKRISKYFIQGLLFIVPLFVTVYIIYFLFVKVDRWIGLPIPGTGVLLTLAAIPLIGFFASNFLTSKLTQGIEAMFVRLPLVKMVYTAIRDLVHAFVGDQKRFNRPVMVTLSEKDKICVLGFLTNDNLSLLSLNDSVAVYLPQSYNFAGNLLVVPSKQVTPVDIDPGDVMKFIVAGGVTAMKVKQQVV